MENQCTKEFSLSLSLSLSLALVSTLNAEEYNSQTINNAVNITDISSTTNSTFNDKVSITNTGTLNAKGTNSFLKGIQNKGTLNVSEGSTFKGSSGLDAMIDNSLLGKINITGGTDSEITFNNKVGNYSNSTINATGKVYFRDGLVNEQSSTFNAGNGSATTIISGNIINNNSATLNANGAIFTGTIRNENKATINATGINEFFTINTNANTNIIIKSGTTTFRSGLENNGNFTNQGKAHFMQRFTTGNFTNTISSETIFEREARFSRGFTNNGTITATSIVYLGSGMENSGTLNAQSRSSFEGIGTITNTGIINANALTGDSVIFEVAVANNANENGKGINATGNVNFKGGVTNGGNFNAGNGNVATTIGGNITNNFKLNINSATFSGAISNSNTINATNATFNGALTNSGALTSTGTNIFNAITTSANSSIIVESGKTTFNQSFDNVANATLINKGETVIASGKMLTNNGTFNAESGSRFSGAIANSGTINAESNSIFSGGEITNSKTLNAKGATFSAVWNDGTINATNANSFTNGITNNGILNAESNSIFSGGTLTNSKTLNAKGAIFKVDIKTEQSSLINISGANLNTFEKALINNGSFTNNGKVRFLGRFTNYGDFSNVAGSETTFESGATFAKQFTNNGTITSANIFDGDIENKGTLNAKGATFRGNIIAGTNSKINISGESLSTFEKAIDNKGSFTNNGKVRFLERFTNNGTFSNTANSEATFAKGAIFNSAIINLGYLEARDLVAINAISSNSGTLNLNGATLKIADNITFSNSGNLAFSFVNGMSKIELGTNSKFQNTENNGKVEINLRGLKVSSDGYQIIAGKDDSVTIDESNAILKESDIVWINGSATYLNGRIFVSEVFANISNSNGAINTPIIATQRANVASMNNMFLISNAIISSNNAKSKKIASADSRRIMQNFSDSRDLVAVDSLQVNNEFFYKNDLLLADARGKAQNNAKASVQGESKYFFLLTPFVNYTAFNKFGDYQISGLDYGFITAFGGKINENNTLGVHFVFDYAKLSDKNDKSLTLANMNLMAGLNYRLDLIYDMYLKVRGDFYYFINQVNSNIANAKPNNLGGGVSVAYGKDFDFDKGGVLGIELGFDYKAFNTSKISTDTIFGGSNPTDEYNSALYHLVYADLGLSYNKYFSTSVGLWGLDAGLGARANLTPKIASGNTLMVGDRAIDISLDNDNFLGYVNIGGSYVAKAQNYDMEFTLRYNGSFGDKTISNGGSFEWRIKW